MFTMLSVAALLKGSGHTPNSTLSPGYAQSTLSFTTNLQAGFIMLILQVRKLKLKGFLKSTAPGNRASK